MARRGNVRRMYPGGNTYKGFYSFYDNILRQEEAKRIIVIKGGPGVGKSSFMKKIGNEMNKRGFDVEYHHCSSDNNSVDGVVLPKVGVALIDGTAPHVVDPKNPGGVDEILHLGDYWNEEELRACKDEIIKDNKEVGRFFKRAYGYLRAAKGIYDNIKANIEDAVDYPKANRITGQLVKEILGTISFNDKLGKERHLFGSAITPDGVKDYLETLIEPNEIIFLLKGEYDSVESQIIEKIGRMAIDKGYDVEFFHNHFIPEKVDHIVIKDLSVAITTSEKFNSIDNKTIIFDICLNQKLLNDRGTELEHDTKKFDELINMAVFNINRAKKVHDRMEQYYISNMDFAAIDGLKEKILQRILKWAEED